MEILLLSDPYENSRGHFGPSEENLTENEANIEETKPSAGDFPDCPYMKPCLKAYPGTF